MARCLYCYKELGEEEKDFHKACSKKMFGTHDVPELPYTRENLADLARQVIRSQTTLTGVQAKLSLDINRGERGGADRFTIVGLWGRFILKPQTDRFDCLPEVEDLTMHLAELAKMKGLDDVYEKYNAKAKEMAAAWESETKVKDHYELAYGAGGKTWSQKYNMVWDKLWQTNIIPNNAMQTELKYYLKKQNKYGLPLDSRKDYTKSDWIMWTAAMTSSDKDFQAFVDPLYKYINETESRVPISDWHDTKTGHMTGFKARSVIGGYWMKVLMDKTLK